MRGRSGEEGVVLLMVLTVIVLTISAVYAFARTSMLSVMAERQRMHHTRAELLARSSIEVGIRAVIEKPHSIEERIEPAGCNAIGAVVVVAMMARVALGHTGRALEVGPWISAGFICLCAAWLCRIWIPLLWPTTSPVVSYLLSIALWLLGYGLFVIIYTPILCRARVDGRAG